MRIMAVHEALQREEVVSLLLRYWGMGRKLDDPERDMLMLALDEENKFLSGPTHLKALERLREMGIK